jgi:hypothetical protein
MKLLSRSGRHGGLIRYVFLSLYLRLLADFPHAVLLSSNSQQIMWNCVTAYHPTVLDALTKERPLYAVDSDHYDSETRALCIMHAMNKLVPELIPISAELISSFLADVGLDNEIMSNAEAEELAADGDGTPKVIGSFIASKIIEDMQTDGFNYKGMDISSGECTANCRPLTDTTGYTPTGYTPKNAPWKITDPKTWQPLIESDGLGFFYAQEHVTPHIGTMAKPVIFSREDIDARNLGNPKYKYKDEVKLAIEHVAELAGDAFNCEMVAFMDNKINIAGKRLYRCLMFFCAAYLTTCSTSQVE